MIIDTKEKPVSCSQCTDLIRFMKSLHRMETNIAYVKSAEDILVISRNILNFK